MIDPERVLKLLGPTQTVHARRCLLAFYWRDGVFYSEPQRPFKPVGLMIWGAPAGAKVEHAIVGSNLQLVVSLAPVPCEWFSTAKNYEQVAAMLDEGKDLPQWADWDHVIPGQRFTLTIRSADGRDLGPKDGIELVAWGFATWSELG